MSRSRTDRFRRALGLGIFALPLSACGGAPAAHDAVDTDGGTGATDDPAPRLEEGETPTDDYSAIRGEVRVDWNELALQGPWNDVIVEGHVDNLLERDTEIEIFAVATFGPEDEEVQIPLYAGTLGKGESVPVSVAVESLPLVGPGSPTDLVVVARVPYDEDFHHEIRSERRHVELMPDHEIVTVQEPPRAVDIDEALQWASAKLSPPKGEAQKQTQGPQLSASAAGATAPDTELGTTPTQGGGGLSWVVSARLCTSWRVHYVDSDPRQVHLAAAGLQEVPASFARILITTPWETFPPFTPGTEVFEGFLDENGCTPMLELWTGDYVFSLETRLHTETHDIEIQYHRNDGLDDFGYASAPFSVHADGTVTRRTADDNRATRVAAILSHAIVTPGLPIEGSGTLEVFADEDCEFSFLGIYPAACGSASNLSIGTNDADVDMSTVRHVVAHEFGHFIQGNGLRRLGGEGYDMGASSDPLCNCNHVEASNDLHCLQSRETITNAFREGFAHFVAARMFNDPSASPCRFDYYKEFRPAPAGSPILEPPVSVRCTDIGWMRTQGCEAENTGTEFDWMNFLYSITRGSNAITLDDLWTLFDSICEAQPSGCSVIWQFTWPELVTAVESSALTDAQKETILAAGWLFGVDY